MAMLVGRGRERQAEMLQVVREDDYRGQALVGNMAGSGLPTVP